MKLIKNRIGGAITAAHRLHRRSNEARDICGIILRRIFGRTRFIPRSETDHVHTGRALVDFCNALEIPVADVHFIEIHPMYIYAHFTKRSMRLPRYFLYHTGFVHDLARGAAK